MSLLDGFTFPGISSRVIFGQGLLAQVGSWVARLGRNARWFCRPASVYRSAGAGRNAWAIGGRGFSRVPPCTRWSSCRRRRLRNFALWGRLDHRAAYRGGSGGGAHHLRRVGNDGHSGGNGGWW